MARGKLTEPYIHAVDFLISGGCTAGFAADASDKVFPHQPYQYLAV